MWVAPEDFSDGTGLGSGNISKYIEHKFEIFCFILYGTGESHRILAEYLYENGGHIHAVSGDKCLIILFENPKNWGKFWEKRWKDLLGSDYNQIKEEWDNIDISYRDVSYDIAEKWGIRRRELPCMVFVQNFESEDSAIFQFLKTENNYEKVFDEIFDCVNKVLNMDISEDEYIEELNKKFNQIERWHFTKSKCHSIKGGVSKVASFIGTVPIVKILIG
ncbi:hypothetical protein [Methanolobus profundi]|uniref:Uncharacterized protein n=1 Tax=Methanolobus profundi TaxID=487685 RepID=A0A1I4P050_9EURY|nr:hypothetical protein [Methanolobus profundi]SFM21109.1 hypothetical protein SAMN04488696_0373 [Methanolobus profundi]